MTRCRQSRVIAAVAWRRAPCRAMHEPRTDRLSRNCAGGAPLAAHRGGHRDLSARGQRRGADAARFVEGLRARGHEVQLVRPRQAPPTTAARASASRGADARRADPALPAPAHGPAGASARSSGCGRMRRPDVVHIATEGPLGWSALRAAPQLKLPVVSDFRTNFHAYSSALRRGLAAACRSSPTCATSTTARSRTMVPTDGAARRAGGARLRAPARWWRAASTRRCSHPSGADEQLRAQWGAAPGRSGACSTSAASPPRRTSPRCSPRSRRRAGARRAPARAGGRRPAAPRARVPLSGSGVRRPAERRRPGPPLRVGRPVPVPQPDRDLRQRDARGDGQRPAGGGLRPRRRRPADRARQRAACWCRWTTTGPLFRRPLRSRATRPGCSH